jgi:hypothetical protein
MRKTRKEAGKENKKSEDREEKSEFESQNKRCSLLHFGENGDITAWAEREWEERSMNARSESDQFQSGDGNFDWTAITGRWPMPHNIG